MKPARAFISMVDPNGLDELARRLVASFQTELVATPRTAAYLRDRDLPVTEVSGRLVIGDDHDPHLRSPGNDIIDLLVVSFPPPFKRPPTQMSFDLILAGVDLLGPPLVRAAIARYERTAIAMDFDDQLLVLSDLMTKGDLDVPLCRRLARRALSRLAAYEVEILRELTSFDEEAIRQDMSEIVMPGYARLSPLVSATPHQEAWLYAKSDAPAGTLPKAMNFNPHVGAKLTMARARAASSAIELLAEHPRPTAMVMARERPIVVATAETLEAALAHVAPYLAPALSGSVLALNGHADDKLLERIAGVPADMLVAPSFDPVAIEALAARADLALLATGGAIPPDLAYLSVRLVPGAMLVEPRDARCRNEVESADRGARIATEDERRALVFAWAIAKYVPSDAVVIASERLGTLRTVGIGGGAVTRRQAIEEAIADAGEHAAGAVLASDAPILEARDFERLAEAGITAVAHPGSPHDSGRFFTKARELVAILATGVAHER